MKQKLDQMHLSRYSYFGFLLGMKIRFQMRIAWVFARSLELYGEQDSLEPNFFGAIDWISLDILLSTE